ncbi:DUF3443 family protein [Trinickia violacea]|uniref:DUF3443 family protein n=1 Tax=Trinickia violacea TaxID=2571746 RepID=A0A4P8J3S5_9BURK|nr:DUF3443 family protein [Trinickia violacea]QCP53249.1 DUF3443 family protein [Trinickia violacea]
MKMTRLLAPFSALIAALALTACGGGGGSSGTAANSSSTTASPSTPASTPTPALASNQQLVIVTQNSFNNAPNVPMTSVTICVPNTTNCQTINNVLVDTGSSGLRLQASVLNSTFAALAPATATGGGSLAECAEFGSGYTWGSVRMLDVKLASETASNIPVQIAGDSVGPVPTSNCSGSQAMDTPSIMGANGILGIGTQAEDCSGCTSSTTGTPSYYSCTSSSTACTPVLTPTSSLVVNPVAHFATDNNGVALQLPAVATTAPAIFGTLTFGIGTQSNNQLGSAQIFTTQAGTHYFSSNLNGNSTPFTIIDSGTNNYFLPNTGLPVCASTSWLCPTVPWVIAGTLQGVSGTNASVSFDIVSEQTLHATGNWVQNSLGADSTPSTPLTATFGTGQLADLGLPFFFGRTVYTAIQGHSTPGGTGPYVAF